MKREDLYIGQKIYICPIILSQFNYKKPRLSKIKKIGRKYATFDDYGDRRFEIETGKIDCGDYSSAEKIVLNVSDYYDEVDKEKLRFAILDKIKMKSDSVSLDDFEKAARALKCEVELCQREED